ncbi:Protein DOWNSTREAM OF FLC [Linum perenne]
MAPMARWSLMLVLAILPALAMSEDVGPPLAGRPFVIQGAVYCDTCRCGFETNKTTYIPGATVAIKCKDRKTLQPRYSNDATTDNNGKYLIAVEDDHGDQICESVLVSSPLEYCNVPDPGRSYSEVILTRSNGAISNLHFANAMGFLKDEAEDGCTELVHDLLFSDL